MKENLRDGVSVGKSEINSYGGERETVTNRKTKAMSLTCAGSVEVREGNRGEQKESNRLLFSSWDEKERKKINSTVKHF